MQYEKRKLKDLRSILVLYPNCCKLTIVLQNLNPKRVFATMSSSSDRHACYVEPAQALRMTI